MLQMGYLTNSEDYAKISDSQFQKRIGEAVAQAFLNTVDWESQKADLRFLIAWTNRLKQKLLPIEIDSVFISISVVQVLFTERLR